ncbi:MAG: 2-hydroxychromene-2-carboxylate isomerase [Burkholderiaceae bacterium]
MTPTIEYFYSTHSAFAWLGSKALSEIAARQRRVLVHRPFDLRRLFVAIGHEPTGSINDARRRYFFGREIERWAQYRSVPVLGRTPTWHHHDLALSSGVMLAAIEQAERVDQLAHAMLCAHWQHDADLASEADLARIIQAVGLAPAGLLARAVAPDIVARYHANTDEAIARSLFGSPTYVVDGDPFYGQDRLELVEQACTTRFTDTWQHRADPALPGR